MREKKLNNPNIFKGIFSTMLISIGLLVCCIIFSSFHVKAIDEIIDIDLNPIVSFDEVSVEFSVNGYLRFETDVIITESNSVYINIEELFINLGVKCVSKEEGNQLAGFIENESKTYNIDFNSKQITIENKTIKSLNGIIKESGEIYIESTVITEAFGLITVFNFRSLSIKMEANFELPVIKQMRLEQMHQNVSKLKNEQIIADTIIKRDYHFLKLGMMDWSLTSFQTKDEIANNRVVLGVGAELLFGQANVSVYYDDKYKFDKRQLYYNWRWVDNDKSAIRQAQLGKIYNQSISFLEAPVVGAALSNTPTTIRKASGSYTINEYTEPNWTVELYINDVLVDYTVADASGLFVFKVPIVYGYTTLKLKFYGPMGEERIEERIKNVPFTFMPAKTLEYNMAGGVLQDFEGSRFGKGVVNYGINSFITVGGGLEYLSSIPDYPYIPFATLAFQPFSKMVLNLEYAHNIKVQGLLNYYFGKSAFLEIDYADFVDGQLATRFNANEELKVRLSLPFKMNKVSGYTKLNFNQFAYDAFNYNQFDAVFSGYYKNYSANLSTLFNWISENEPYITSNLSLSYRMKNGFVFRPSAEYNVSSNQLLRFKAEIEKRVAKAYFSVSYERNVAYKTDNVFVSLRYDLPFARAGVSASYNNNNFYFSENAQGSVAFGANKTIKTGNNSSLSKGGILFYPFLDFNHNGDFDKGEQMVLLSNVRVLGGRAVISEKDSIVRISDLNAFVDYTVEFSNSDLDNIAWRFKHKTYQVLVDPNQYKKVYVPVLSVGEVSGMVYLNKDNNVNGLGRITIQIIDKQGKKVAETLSERDGYFSYLGLKPGNYKVRIDEQQLEKLEYQSTPVFHNFLIKELIDGDIVEGLDFVLQPKETTSSIQNTENRVLNVNEKANSEEQLQVIKIVNKTEVKKEIKPDFITVTKLPEKVLKNDSLDVKQISHKTQVNNSNTQNGNTKAAEAGLKAKTKSNINTSFKNITDVDELFYTVQIGVYRNYVTAKQLKNLTPIFYEVLSNGTNKYFSGKYNSAAEAETAKTNIIKKGIKGARVVSCKNGKRITAFVITLPESEMKVIDKEIFNGQYLLVTKINGNVL